MCTPKQRLDDPKWGRRGAKGVLLGYTNVGYRILLNNKIIVAKHVEFLNKYVQYIGITPDSDLSSEENSDI